MLEEVPVFHSSPTSGKRESAFKKTANEGKGKLNRQLIDKHLLTSRRRLDEVETLMADPEVISDRKKMIEIGREHRRLRDILDCASRIEELEQTIEQSRELLDEDDEEMVELAREEIAAAEETLEQELGSLQVALLPVEKEDARAAIVEIRAGTGGEEASLFANDLLKMYQRYIESQGWKFELLNMHASELGGIKEIVFAVRGDSTFGTLKYEGGVHRVQRVPETESQGRVHTSAATVAVLPEADEVDVRIDPNELRIDVYRSSGPGGQSVNTTDSAVRITHLPTGLVVTCQDEKSQLKNKVKAMKVLRSRLYEKALNEEREKADASRRSLVGSGDRSAKIRTYNYPQNRVTDHRINLTLYKLEEILQGDLSELINALKLADAEEKLRNELSVAESS